MILGIDYGEAKIGLALADEKTAKPLAVPLTIIRYRSWLKEAAPQVVKIIKEYGVDKIIIGEPISAKQADQLPLKNGWRDFGRELAKITGLEIIFFDEQTSTKAAQKLIKNWPTPKRKNDDAVAAQVILQSWLDSNYA